MRLPEVSRLGALGHDTVFGEGPAVSVVLSRLFRDQRWDIVVRSTADDQERRVMVIVGGQTQHTFRCGGSIATPAAPSPRSSKIWVNAPPNEWPH